MNRAHPVQQRCLRVSQSLSRCQLCFTAALHPLECLQRSLCHLQNAACQLTLSMRQAGAHGMRLLGSLAQAASQPTWECLQARLTTAGLANQSSLWQQCTWSTRHWLNSSLRGFAASARSGGAAQKGTAAAAATAADKQQAGSFSKWWKTFKTVPAVPKVLGLAGAIPFVGLAPPVAKHLTGVLPTDVADNPAVWQVCYGVTIVTFLGAVHWGVAMSSSLSNPVAARIANEAFIYSVIPSLLAWPVALMEPGAGSLILSILLPACYLADYSRRNLGLPQWYMALRVPLTLLATFGMLLTATRHVHQEFDRAKQIATKQGTASRGS